MRKQPTQATIQKKFRRLFIFIGVPLASMCATFSLLYIAMPFRSISPILNSVVARTSQNLVAVNQVIVGPPVRLKIPSINVDTIINPVGMTSSGAMDISENPDQVAWYKLGAIPGQVGSAVIAGHYGWQQDGHGAIFNNLNKLKAGDVVSVYDAASVETDFTVRTSRLYDPTADADTVFNSTDGKAHLNLITCQGTWVNAKNSYSKRLVVFTDVMQK